MATGVASWSGTAASNATADTNVNWAEGMAPSQVNDSARAMMASVSKFRDDISAAGFTGGTATAYTYASLQGFASFSALNQMMLAINFNLTNGASPTLNVDSLGAKPIQVDSQTAIATGCIRAGSIHRVTYVSSAAAFVLHGGHALVEPGRIAETALSSAPPGWLMCDGSAVSRTTYADLFAAISTTFGIGDGSTTFNVPNRKGKVAVGVDSGSSVITGAASLGSTQGEQNHTLSSGEMPVHNHTATDSGHTHPFSLSILTSTASGSTLGGGGAAVGQVTVSSNTGTGTANISVGNAGSGSAHNNMQPTIAMNFVIKT